MSDLKIIARDDKNFSHLWDEFCARNESPVFFSLIWMDVCKAMLGERLVNDLSFVITKDNQSVGIGPLLMESGIYGNQFSINGNSPLNAPIVDHMLSYELKRQVERESFCHIDETAYANGVAMHLAAIDPLTLVGQKFAYNYLLEFNYLNCSILTNIVDLQRPKDILWSNVRRRFKSFINKEEKNCRIAIIDYRNESGDLFQEFINLYFLAAGKKVHSEEVWAILRETVRRDQAALILAQLEDQIVGGYYFNHWHNKAYYSLGANHPKYESTHFIGHLLIWKALEYYADRGFDLLELGWQFYGRQFLENPTEKEINISYFKRGFGGFNFPLHRGVKFYNDEARRTFLQKAFGPAAANEISLKEEA